MLAQDIAGAIQTKWLHQESNATIIIDKILNDETFTVFGNDYDTADGTAM